MVKRYFYLLLIGLTFLMFGTEMKGQADVKFVNEFLNIGVGARAHGMYGSVTATVDDITAGYWNPAGLARIESPVEASAMHASWFGGIANYDYVGVGKKFNDRSNSYGSMSLIRMGVDNIPNTLNLIEPDGSINYDEVLEFSAADYAFLMSYGQDIKGIDGLSIGGSAKIIYRKIGSFGSAFGFGADLGLMYKKGNLSIGIMGRDITTTVNNWSFSLTPEENIIFQQSGNVIPVSSTEVALPKLIVSGAYLFQQRRSPFSYLVEGDLRLSSDGTQSGVFSGKNIGIDPSFGLEVAYNKQVYVRMGIGNFQKTLNEAATSSFEFQPNVGLGLTLGRFSIDYALTNLASVSGSLVSHIFSVKLSLEDR